MTTHATYRLVRWGFTLAYLAVMGILVVIVMPWFGGIESQVIQFVLIPLGLTGVAMLLYGRWKYRETVSDVQ
jgi:fermentation-respiration switch protein FrsA (DUF1100 family)